MSLSLVLMAYVAGLATATLGLCVRAVWLLREPRRAPMPKMIVHRLVRHGDRLVVQASLNRRKEWP